MKMDPSVIRQSSIDAPWAGSLHRGTTCNLLLTPPGPAHYTGAHVIINLVLWTDVPMLNQARQ